MNDMEDGREPGVSAAQHSIERKQDEDRWRWVIGLLVGVLVATSGMMVTGLTWGGRISANVETAQEAIKETTAEIAAAESRLAALEANREGANVEIAGLRRDLADIKSEQRQLVSEIRELTVSINRALGGQQP